MGRIKTIARRTFLIGSTAVVGGVAFGVYKLKETPPNPLTSAPGKTSLNAFVIINQDGVTLVAPKAEMGQGVQSTWAALIAEELDVEWEKVNVIHGPPAKAYYNSALLGLALPFTDYEIGPFKNNVREFVGEAAKLLNIQVTGGSTSMRDGFERMRIAGAAARETIKLAAANRLDIDVKNLRTENGFVITPDGTMLAYSELAEDAVLIAPPSVKLRDAKDWRILGKSMPRLDMLGKVTGTAEYAIDTKLDGMLFASVRFSPKRGAMTAFDRNGAESMPGVKQVLDLGDGVAVVATNTWLAMQAVDKIEIEWATSGIPDSSADFYENIKAAFDGEANSMARNDGDVDDQHSGTEIAAEYSVPLLAHTTMEPMNATAFLKDGHLTVWAGNQAPGSTQKVCARAAGLEIENVTVNTTLMGGGFGRRGETDFSEIAAKIAAMLPGVPVKTTWTREEDMRRDMYRPAAVARYRGVVENGKAVVLEGKVSAPSVIQQSSLRASGREMNGADREHVSGAFDQPYKVPNFRISGYLAPTELPIGYWRSVGASFNGFFFESFIDEMAHAASRDPLDFRIELARQKHAASAKVIETAAKLSNWSGKTEPGTGRGVAFSHTFGSSVCQVIEVKEIDGLIRINKVWIACDVGIALDPRNIEAQMTGGCLFGLSAAVMGEITLANQEVEQVNFPDYDALRMYNSPRFEVEILENNQHLGGVGEPGTPPAAAALSNALFDLTGRRARTLPLSKHFDFLL